jgi:hypothetical protein
LQETRGDRGAVGQGLYGLVDSLAAAYVVAAQMPGDTGDRYARASGDIRNRRLQTLGPGPFVGNGDLEDAEISRLGETDPTVSELKAQGELCPARVGAIREAT